MNTGSRFLPLLLSLTLAACASAGSPSSSAPPDGGARPACGLATYPADFPATCQAALDEACCDEERACANDSDCVKLVACINACPSPRTDACVSACGGDASRPPGGAALDAIGACTKRPSYHAPATCNWPS